MTKVVIFETNKNKISIANFDEKKSDLTLLLAMFLIATYFERTRCTYKEKVIANQEKTLRICIH